MTTDARGCTASQAAAEKAYIEHAIAEDKALMECRTSEQIIVDLIREDLGVAIEPQAFRMFLRHRWGKIHAAAHRIHEGKR